MGEREITRRQVLAGVAGVGGVGSVLGGGTAALFTDEEIFEGSRFKSGTVDLAVEARREGETYSGQGDIEVPLRLEKPLSNNHEESDRSNVADSRGTKDSTTDSDGTPAPEEPDQDPTPTETTTETDTPETTSTPEEPGRDPTPTETNTPEPTPEGTPTPTATPGDERSGNGTGGGAGDGRVSTMGGGQEGLGVSSESDSSVWQDAFQVTVWLPNHDGENNAAFGWVGAQCPTDDFESGLNITIQYADVDSEPLYAGPVAGLAGGIPLDPDGGANPDDGEHRCFEPSDEEGERDGVDLEIVVEHEDPEDNDETTFTLEFVGRQCRYDQATNPFPDDPDCDTHEDGDEEAFSFVGFCSSSHGSIDPTFERVERRGQLDAVAWSTETRVDFVVVKKSTWYTVYDLRDDDPADEGILAWQDPDADVPSEPMASGSPSEHCSVAVDAVDATDYDGENTEKVEWNDVTWEEDQ